MNKFWYGFTTGLGFWAALGVCYILKQLTETLI